MKTKGPLHGPHLQWCRREEVPFVCYCFANVRLSPAVVDTEWAEDLLKRFLEWQGGDHGLRS
jgi:hypothetical protein